MATYNKEGTFYNDRHVHQSSRHNNQNIYAPNKNLSKYIMQKLTEFNDEIGKSTLRVGDFNSSL